MILFTSPSPLLSVMSKGIRIGMTEIILTTLQNRPLVANQLKNTVVANKNLTNGD